MTDDPFNLQRFIAAQESGNSYAEALHEIKTGAKLSHWIWYIFPQLSGLGTSYMCQKYGISGIAEARAYLANETLHDRLIEITIAAVNALPRFDISLVTLLGGIDALKFRSSMTLFLAASTTNADRNVFAHAIVRTCEGRVCDLTKQMLGITTPSIADRRTQSIAWLRKIITDGNQIFIDTEKSKSDIGQYTYFTSDAADCAAYSILSQSSPVPRGNNDAVILA